MGFHPQWLGHTMIKHDGFFWDFNHPKMPQNPLVLWDFYHHPQPHSLLTNGLYLTIPKWQFTTGDRLPVVWHFREAWEHRCDFLPRLYSLDHCLLSGEKRIKWLSWLKKRQRHDLPCINTIGNLMLLIWRWQTRMGSILKALPPYRNSGATNLPQKTNQKSYGDAIFWGYFRIHKLPSNFKVCSTHVPDLCFEARDLQPRLIGWGGDGGNHQSLGRQLLYECTLKMGGLADSESITLFL